MPMSDESPAWALVLLREIAATRKHAAFIVFIGLDGLFLLVAVGLQSRHHWSLEVADYAYVIAGMVLIGSLVEIYHGHRR